MLLEFWNRLVAPTAVFGGSRNGRLRETTERTGSSVAAFVGNVRHVCGRGLLSGSVALAVTLTPMVAVAPAQGAGPPNVVVILVDDMRADDLDYMPFTRHLFAAEGTTFTGSISPHPICCPARAGLLTGQYAQNNGVHHNGGPFGGWSALTSRDRLVPEWFQRAGYRTGYTGKFLNGYRGGRIQGLTDNDAFSANHDRATGFEVWNNGDPRTPVGHQTDYIARHTGRLAQEYARGPAPFYLWAGFYAPHTMESRDGRTLAPVPPARYDAFRSPDHARPASFDSPAYREPDLSDKPSTIVPRPFTDQWISDLHRGRVLSLYAVDDGVRRIVADLKAAGVYENTILVFTSDNGYLLGEHDIVKKNWPYQQSLRVPLLLAGPGVPAGATVSRVATLVDIPKTLAQLTGVRPGRVQDGTNLLAIPPDRAVLIQAGSMDRRWKWRGVYTQRYTAVWHHTGEAEVYDRVLDASELTSIHRREDRAGTVTSLRRTFEGLRACAGSTCQAVAP